MLVTLHSAKLCIYRKNWQFQHKVKEEQNKMWTADSLDTLTHRTTASLAVLLTQNNPVDMTSNMSKCGAQADLHLGLKMFCGGKKKRLPSNSRGQNWSSSMFSLSFLLLNKRNRCKLYSGKLYLHESSKATVRHVVNCAKLRSFVGLVKAKRHWTPWQAMTWTFQFAELVIFDILPFLFVSCCFWVGNDPRDFT